MKSGAIAPKDVARRKGWTLKYVYDLLAAGRIPGARKVGKHSCIPAGPIAGLDKARGPLLDVTEESKHGAHKV
jgi:hypothetical protein